MNVNKKHLVKLILFSIQQGVSKSNRINYTLKSDFYFKF